MLSSFINKLPDYHIHTFLCGHAIGQPHQYIETAKKLNLREIGFSEHINLIFPDKILEENNLAVPRKYYEKYFNLVSHHQRIFNFPIKLGCELDYSPETESELKQFISQHNFDYTIGSVHFADKKILNHFGTIEIFNSMPINNIYEKYFYLLQKSASSKLFDIIAHCDILKISTEKRPTDAIELMKQTAEIFKSADICTEINTSGLIKPCKEIFPSKKFLEILYKEDVPITLGSDAHEPNRVGKNFDKAIQLAKEVGYNEIAVFNKRKRSFIEI